MNGPHPDPLGWRTIAIFRAYDGCVDAIEQRNLQNTRCSAPGDRLPFDSWKTRGSGRYGPIDDLVRTDATG